jgi:hypothetical protein
MTARFLRFAAATAKQFKILAYDHPPALLPPNLGSGRFVWFAIITGFGYPGISNVLSKSFALFDFNSALNEYELSNVVPHTDGGGLEYGPSTTGRLCMIDATTLEIITPSATSGSCDRTIITVGAAPAVSMTYASRTVAAYAEVGAANNLHARSTPFAYSGNMLYGFWVGQQAGVYSATNGYVEKVSPSATSRNATALRSSLPTDSTQGNPVKSVAALGGATPNGYLVADVSDFISSSGVFTCRYQLVNCTSTPVAVGTQLTFSGNAASNQRDRLVALSATQVVAIDQELSGTSSSRLSLLNTNSATAPTTLTKGAEALMPPPVGYTAGQVQYSAVIADENASNNFIVSGKAVVWVRWYMVAGNVIHRPVVIASTGAANLTITQLPATDLRGHPLDAIPGGIGGTGPVVGAPGGKVVVFAQRARDSLYEQFCYQL